MHAGIPLSWPKGNGWLVLSGGAHLLSDVRALALSRLTVIDGTVAYLGLHEDDAEEMMDDLGELGAPTGYLIDILREDDESIHSMLDESGLIAIPGAHPPSALQAAITGAAVEGIRAAYQRGAVILAEGPAAMIFGKKVLTHDGTIIDGLNWLENAFIMPSVTSISQSQIALEVLAGGAAHLAIGIGEGSALALGPQGAVETWGERQVTITLGGGSGVNGDERP